VRNAFKENPLLRIIEALERAYEVFQIRFEYLLVFSTVPFDVLDHPIIGLPW